ncbi:hypothetical protein C8A03DRAFT_41808 [Achaetomium macrosporum]|uniref:Uncharacterized protein n=1 Tax=Achaetomium macrosporum TaxID=79813 RepID=A0AAN7CEQ0_9PEZI|nr:hypothetical protein C8A03DRAFT_41808 [Achaetomium macrosporum]
MPTIRNPFARRPGPAVQDENQRPGSAAGDPGVRSPGFERVDTVGSKASSAFSIRSRKSQDNGEYKLSVVNDSGVYLPPSPIEREVPWPRRYLSRTSSDKSSVGSGEIEHFPISRESFDSYRRSFDICAKSPVVITDPLPARQSLDSMNNRFPFPPTPRSARFPRSSLGRRPEEGEKGEEKFEEVGLDDDTEPSQSQQSQQQPKKRGFFFAKFSSDSTSTGAEETGTAMARFLPLPGRKREQSAGQGAELGVMPAAGLDRTERVETPVAALQTQEV